MAAVKNTTLENKCQILLTAELQKQHTEIRTITPVLYDLLPHMLCVKTGHSLPQEVAPTLLHDLPVHFLK